MSLTLKLGKRGRFAKVSELQLIRNRRVFRRKISVIKLFIKIFGFFKQIKLSLFKICVLFPFKVNIEAPRSKLWGIFDRKEVCYFSDSLANPAASCWECARFCGSGEQLGMCI